MSAVKIRKASWMILAEGLFGQEYVTPVEYGPDDKLEYTVEKLPKAFYEKFAEPADLYLVLSQRIVERTVEVSVAPRESAIGETANVGLTMARLSVGQTTDAAAYKLMQEAFNRDAQNANRDSLETMAEIYKALITQEG